MSSIIVTILNAILVTGTKIKKSRFERGADTYSSDWYAVKGYSNGDAEKEGMIFFSRTALGQLLQKTTIANPFKQGSTLKVKARIADDFSLSIASFEVQTEGPGAAEISDFGVKPLNGSYQKRDSDRAKEALAATENGGASTKSDKPASVGAPMEAK